MKDSEPRILSALEKEQLAGLKVGRAPFPIQDRQTSPIDSTHCGWRTGAGLGSRFALS